MPSWNNQTKYSEKSDVAILESTSFPFSLIVWNDEVNTFDWVIRTLVEVCEHSEEQAEQCATIVHYKGKYIVKHGSKEDMIERAKKLSEEHLTVEVI